MSPAFVPQNSYTNNRPLRLSHDRSRASSKSTNTVAAPRCTIGRIVNESSLAFPPAPPQLANLTPVNRCNSDFATPQADLRTDVPSQQNCLSAIVSDLAPGTHSRANSAPKPYSSVRPQSRSKLGPAKLPFSLEPASQAHVNQLRPLVETPFSYDRVLAAKQLQTSSVSFRPRQPLLYSGLNYVLWWSATAVGLLLSTLTSLLVHISVLSLLPCLLTARFVLSPPCRELADLYPSILPRMAVRGRDASDPPSQPSPQEVFDAGTTGLLFLILGSISQVFMVIVVGLRLYTKQTILRRWTLDDLYIVLAAILTTAYFAVGCYAVTAAATASIAAGHAVDSFYISKWLTEWVSALAFAFIKLSFFSLYMQIFKPIKSLRIAALIGAIYCTILWTILFGHGLSTTPKIGQSWADASNTRAAQDERILVLLAGPFDVLSDIHILAIPLLGIRKLNLKGKKKAGVLALVLTGMLALAASIVSLYYRLKYRGDAPTEFSFYAVTACVIIELQIGVSCASLPAVSALFRKKLASWDATGPVPDGTYTRGRDSQAAAVTRPTARSRTPKKKPADLEAGIERRETEVTVKEVTRTDSDGLTVQGTRVEMTEPPRVHRMRAFSKSTHRSLGDYSPSPINTSSRLDTHAHEKSTRSSRRGSLLRAASPWALRRTDSDENSPLAALGSNILVSTEVHQETRRSSMIDLGNDPHGDMQGVRTVIESPRDCSREVQSQILEAMTGAYGSTYNNGHFPADPKAGWLDR